MKIAATIISWVFMPLFMPIYALLLTMFVYSEQDFFSNTDCLYAMRIENKIIFLRLFFILGTIAPGLSFVIMSRYKLIASLEMDSNKERNLPIIIMLLYCLGLYFIIILITQNILFPKFLFALPLSGAFVCAVFFLLNRWKKISLHAGGAGILTGFLLAYLFSQSVYQLWVLILAVFISGLVMSARLFLRKHTMTEVLIGWFTGTFLTFAVNYFY